MECVRVVTRVRPLSRRDHEMGNKVLIAANKSKNEIIVSGGRTTPDTKAFSYDRVYGPDDTTADIFRENVVPLVESSLHGYNGTVFAYGQTGSGKSYTMHGGDDENGRDGVVPRAVGHIYDAVDNLTEDKRSMVYCSFLEIYKEDLKDLFSTKSNPPGLQLREDKDGRVFVEGLTATTVKSAADCLLLIKRGLKTRRQAVTKMNSESSRSHAIFSLTVEVSENVLGKDRITVGKLNFVDLAGSERQAKSEGEKERLEEAIKINLSLSTLGRVIQALTDSKSQHIPYRDSKLTRLLENSLGGNAKTVMISCVSSVDDNRDESLNTLMYASRAKAIKNQPVVNTDPQTALIRGLLENIRRLEEQIAKTPIGETNEHAREQEISRVREELRSKHEKEIERLEREQEETLKKYERKMRESNEEEKRLVVEQKNEEVSRIQVEMIQRQKIEFRRLEEDKAEEFREMDEKLTHAVKEERYRNQRSMDSQLRDSTNEMEKNISSMDKTRKRELVLFEGNLRAELTREHKIRTGTEKRKFEDEFRLKSLENQKRLEAKARVENNRIQKEANQEITNLEHAKTVELQRLKDELYAAHEAELKRLANEQALIIQSLKDDHRSQLTRSREEDRETKEDAVSAVEHDAKRREATKSAELESRFQERLTAKEEELGILHAQLKKAADENTRLHMKLTKNAERLEHAQTEHGSCPDLLEDKEQKYRELEQEMNTVRKKLMENKEAFRLLQKFNVDLQSQVQTLLAAERPANGSVVFEPRSSSKNASHGSKSFCKNPHTEIPPNSGSRVPSISDQSRTNHGDRVLSTHNPSPSARKQALLDAVVSVNLDDRVRDAREVYQIQIEKLTQQLSRKSQEVVMLQQQLEETAKRSRNNRTDQQFFSTRPQEGTKRYPQNSTDVPTQSKREDSSARSRTQLLPSGVANALEVRLDLPLLTCRAKSGREANLFDYGDLQSLDSHEQHQSNSFDFDPHPLITPVKRLSTPLTNIKAPHLSPGPQRRTPRTPLTVRTRNLIS